MARRIRPISHEDRLSIVEHLDELRTRIILCGVAFGVAWTFTIWQNHLILRIVNHPLPRGIEPITLGPAEAFYSTLTNSAYAAVIISLPFILYQVYAFLLPAFSPSERRLALPLLLLIPVLFISGVVFCYFVVLGPALHFLLNFNADQFNTQVRARDYYSFITMLMLAMGLGFQIPVGILAACKLGHHQPGEAAQGAPLRDRRDRGAGLAAAHARPADADPRDDPAHPSLRDEHLAGHRPRQARARGGGSRRLGRGQLAFPAACSSTSEAAVAALCRAPTWCWRC